MSIKTVTKDLFSESYDSKEQDTQNENDIEFSKNKLSILELKRLFTKSGKNPLDTVKYERRSSCITEPSGEIVFELKNLEVPQNWSQLAADILASKYCRRAGVPETGYEDSVKKVIHRITNTLRKYGEEQDYFQHEKEADIFEDELSNILVTQKGAFNSPVWFNVGLFHQYNIKGSGGNYYWDPETNTIKQTKDSFSNPQGSACFINGLDDDLMSIFELVKTEAKLFKFGSGTGTNFSVLRSKDETLSGGGTSSGLLSFLEVLDKGAAATKSGGTTRRAAKMVILDVDHPEIMDFIHWKVREENKAKALIDSGYSSDFNGEAYRTVSGQNSNNSVRVTDTFMQAVEADDIWETYFRVSGEVAKTHKAREIMDEICKAAWASADPGVQYHDTINHWHTCKTTGSIVASNPCSEYMFLNDTACNLASVNLIKYLDEDGNFDVEAYRHTCKILFIAQEILVDLASYPTGKIAQNSHDFRPLGLGYANLGTLLMVSGIPYDSDEARSIAGALTAIMTGHAYKVSAELAQVKGAFNGFSVNQDSMLDVMQLHRDSVENINQDLCPEYLLNAAREDWDKAIELGERYGYRNAQATVLAPTGTIGLLMDCDTTGVEPDFALVKRKKLAGGGSFKIINQSIPRALSKLGYSSDEILDIISYILGRDSLDQAPHINPDELKKLGYTDSEIKEAESDIESSRSLNQYTRHINPDELLKRGLTDAQLEEALQFINGSETVEGSPHLKEEHYPVFDTANKCGHGERFISPMGHVKMMAAVQPFLSGAISKTVNLPHESTIENIEEIYMQGWKLGLKSIAMYRDGSKGSQPLSSEKKKKADSGTKQKYSEEEIMIRVLKGVIQRGEKKSLPSKRNGNTYSANIGGQKIFFRTGEYEEGQLGEIFIDMFKAGASYKSLLNCFAVAVSLGLQYGVPLEKFVDKFIFTRFEPSGFTDHPNVRNATSVLDFIFRILAMDYLGRTDIIQVPDVTTDDTSHNIAQEVEEKVEIKRAHHKSNAGVDDYLTKIDSDAPPCDKCGHITVRNGACYRCLNCGNSMGCS
ncbi:vitamin B12-dependent ribonucleotide reductase [Calditrichota bacterium]